ncbi:MAG TPA: FAD-binding oxidoreductase, partial [Opitutaceae bacterium]|nr:FAD-binding oxidoreductase [Opitutaceae bacterium]
GARIHDRTEVTRWTFHRRGVELFTSRGARVRARWLVVATGYEAGRFLPEPIGMLHSTYAAISEPVLAFAGWPAGRCLIWDTADPYLYLRTTSDGRAIIGGYDEPFRDPRARDRLLSAKVVALRRRFAQCFPRIPFEVATAWAGTFGSTADGLPVIGAHPEVPHTWFALGFGGNGTTFSMIAAEIIREAMLGRADPDAELFGFR